MKFRVLFYGQVRQLIEFIELIVFLYLYRLRIAWRWYNMTLHLSRYSCTKTTRIFLVTWCLHGCTSLLFFQNVVLGRHLSFTFYSGSSLFTFMCFLVFIVYLLSYLFWSSIVCLSHSLFLFFSLSFVLFSLLIIRWIPIVDRSICKHKGVKERDSQSVKGKRIERRRERSKREYGQTGAILTDRYRGFRKSSGMIKRAGNILVKKAEWNITFDS